MPEKKFNHRCSHCGKDSSFSHVEHILVRDQDDAGQDRICSMIMCDICNKVMFFIFRKKPFELHDEFSDSTISSPVSSLVQGAHSNDSNNVQFLRDIQNYYVEDYYPKHSYIAHTAVPKEIAKDFIESNRCYDNQAYNASVAMSRRAIQKICKSRGATKKKLDEQIDEVIPPDLKNFAHEIRLWGNLGAHPDDVIEDVSKDDAREMIDFVEHLFEYLYTMPFKQKESLDRRSRKS